MFTLLVAIAYLAFIGLGLPDSMLGAVWPVISADIGLPVSAQGAISMIISASTIFSSLCGNFAVKKLGTGVVVSASVLLTALAMFCFSACTSLWQLCLCAVPYGLGAGAVDAALNNYAALHFSSRVMNWLHCFWGVGVSVSPFILGHCLTMGMGWQGGYRTMGFVQLAITAILFASLPLWTKAKAHETKPVVAKSTKQALKLRGVWLSMLTLFCYCALEQTALQWASSYLVLHKNIAQNLAATFGTLFCCGITLGRFLSGILSKKLGDKGLIRLGICVIFGGIIALFLPFDSVFALAAFVIIGLGCAPVFPAIMHATPFNFGEEYSQPVVGLQMACAYLGSTFMPPLFGVFAQASEWVMPLYLGIFALTLAVVSETLNKRVRTTAA